METEERRPLSRILVVDDEPEITRFVQVALEQHGYQVKTASTGREALHYIMAAEDRHPDVIVLDVMMPELHGLEVLRRLKENEATADIPVVVLTAKDSMDDTMNGIEAGADFYWTKPFDIMELVRVVKLILKEKDLNLQPTEDETALSG